LVDTAPEQRPVELAPERYVAWYSLLMSRPPSGGLRCASVPDPCVKIDTVWKNTPPRKAESIAGLIDL
jgi:hypothetical protein